MMTTQIPTETALGALTQIDQAIRTLRQSLHVDQAPRVPARPAAAQTTGRPVPHLYSLTTDRPSQTVLKRATPATRAIVACLLTYPKSTKARIMRMTGYRQSTVENAFHVLRTQRLLVGAPPAL